MPNETQSLDRIFHCLSSSTRRGVIELLSLSTASMSDLAAPFDMALPSFLQHLQVLEDAGLVSSSKTGRVRTYAIQPPALLLADNWLDVQRKRWSTRLDQLDSLLHHLNEEKPL